MHSLIPELVVELTIAQRPTKVSDRLLDEPAELASIGQLDLDVSLIFGDASRLRPPWRSRERV